MISVEIDFVGFVSVEVEEALPLIDADNDNDDADEDWPYGCVVERCDYHRHSSVQNRNYLKSIT